MEAQFNAVGNPASSAKRRGVDSCFIFMNMEDEDDQSIRFSEGQ